MKQDSSISGDVRAAIKEVLNKEIARFGYDDEDVRSGQDHDGDEILVIEVKYKYLNKGAPIEPKVIAGLVTKIRDRLWALGERRFPHIRHRFDERQKVVELH